MSEQDAQLVLEIAQLTSDGDDPVAAAKRGQSLPECHTIAVQPECCITVEHLRLAFLQIGSEMLYQKRCVN